MSQSLVETSKKIISLLEQPQADAHLFAKDLLPLLSDLFKIISILEPKYIDSSVISSAIDPSNVKQRLTTIFQGESLYKQVFDPMEDVEAVTFSLVNDLCEIYEGLSIFLGETKINPNAAEWNFKEDFRSHLFQHVLNAIKVLYMAYCKDE